MDIEQLAGTKLGSYEIESLLGRGGMGVVYDSRGILLNGPVPLKIFFPTLDSDSSFTKMFQREAEATIENVLQIYDFGEKKNLPFFTMKHMGG